MEFNTDTELIKALNKGENEAYLYLFDTYYNRLNAYAIGLIHDYTKAQDIVQNVFLKTWEYRTKLDPQYPIKGFLYRLTYNEFINTYKKDKPVSILEEKHIETLSEVMEDLDESRVHELLLRIKHEIKSLPRKSQLIFELSKKEGLTNKEISEYLDVSIKTVEAHISKVFEFLREKLSNEYGN